MDGYERDGFAEGFEPAGRGRDADDQRRTRPGIGAVFGLVPFGVPFHVRSRIIGPGLRVVFGFLHG